MDILNKEKTEITISKQVYKINDIELFYTQDNTFVLCVGEKRVKIKCQDAPKFFREIASEFIINEINNFALLVTGNNMVNLNKIKHISQNDFDLKIETHHHLYILNDANFMEYTLLKSRLKDNNQDLSK